MCTTNKITHLFAHDVYNTALDELPKQHWLWNSNLTKKFSTMTADLIANITNQSTLPIYSQLISNISKSTHQRNHGMHDYQQKMLAVCTTRCVAWPQQATATSSNPNHNTLSRLGILQNRTWLIFRKYLPTFNNVTVHQPDSDTDYVFKASLNGSREK
jgi:hypothetical protein